MHTPAEDEFALCNATGFSPYIGFAFPRRRDHFDRYLTFQNVPASETERWKAAFRLFLKKLTWKDGRPLILKSPPHTCRIQLLLSLFPSAKFIHIHRHPYAVYQSTQHWDKIALRFTGLQQVGWKERETYLVARYKLIYDRFFAETPLIPADHFHEVSLEALEKDPVAQVRTIYERLAFPDFHVCEPALRRYTVSLQHYQKNEHRELPTALRQRIARVWERSFDEWHYSSYVSSQASR